MIMKKWGAIISALFILGVVSIGASILMPKGGEPQAIATTATVEPPADDPETDLEKIQGTWVRVSTNGVKEEHHRQDEGHEGLRQAQGRDPRRRRPIRLRIAMESRRPMMGGGRRSYSTRPRPPRRSIS